MRFVCDSCRAQYMISDDKIGAKGVKIRCKKCGHVIVVRPTGAAAPKDEGSAEASAPETAAAASSNGATGSAAAGIASLGNPPEGGLFTGVEEDEIGPAPAYSALDDEPAVPPMGARGTVSTAPVSVELSAGSGSTDIAIPVDVSLNGGAARVPLIALR